MAPPTPPDVKAAAIADLLSGEQPAVVAQRHGLDPALVRVWKQRHVTPGVTSDDTNVTVIRRLSTEEYQAHLLGLIVATLEAKLKTVTAIAAHVQNPEWLEKQSTSDVANLFVTFDRSAAATLERLGHGAPPPDPDAVA